MANSPAVPEKEISDEIRRKLNDETQSIMTECLTEVQELLKREAKVYDRFAQELLNKEELDYDLIGEIFDQYGSKTPRRLRPAEVKEGSVGEN